MSFAVRTPYKRQTLDWTYHHSQSGHSSSLHPAHYEENPSCLSLFAPYTNVAIYISFLLRVCLF
ncbi:hypothetical protein PILCRDRAFT_830072 [Piloderma croceum F 1598]|uniref:Uncharacterized protein n=1 Tax=Piloderma croceum (strain F 1598) TaxID=765440 RepID=A0A0C3EGX3_PILCF|nr:hypothetical protein PILCRDRAFT_830072 [Piloderma croceum F 1598]